MARLRAELEEAEGLKDLYVYTAVSTPLSPDPHSYPNRPSNPLRTRARPCNRYRAEVEKYKARDVFETIPDSGDPWPLLNELQPDKVSE